MGVITEVSVRNRQALNQALLFVAKLPPRARRRPAAFIRSLRSALRMSQSQLARRSGVPRAHITRIESERLSPRLETMERLFEAMFCEMVVLPKALQRPGDAIAARRLECPRRFRPWRRIWDE